MLVYMVCMYVCVWSLWTSRSIDPFPPHPPSLEQGILFLISRQQTAGGWNLLTGIKSALTHLRDSFLIIVLLALWPFSSLEDCRRGEGTMGGKGWVKGSENALYLQRKAMELKKPKTKHRTGRCRTVPTSKQPSHLPRSYFTFCVVGSARPSTPLERCVSGPLALECITYPAG